MEAWSLRRLSDLPLGRKGRALNLLGGVALVAIAVTRKSLLAQAALGLVGGGLLYTGATGHAPGVIANRLAQRDRDDDALEDERAAEDYEASDDADDPTLGGRVLAGALEGARVDGLSSRGARDVSLGGIGPADLDISLDARAGFDPSNVDESERLDTSDPLDNAVRLEGERPDDDNSSIAPLDFSENADETDRLGTIRRG